MIHRRSRACTALVLGVLSLLLPAAARATGPAGPVSASTGATLTGTVSQPGARLPGMLVEAQVLGTAPASCAAAAGCFTTYSDRSGRFVLRGLPAATYELSVLDGARPLTLQRVTVASSGSAGAAPSPVSVDLTLGPAAVPAAVVARRSGRDLSLLRRERARAGVPSSVVLNPRWSQECAAHDAYEAAGGVLSSAETPSAPDASPGGAWAGLNSDLAEGRWTPAASPWEQAPIHLLALLAPSLSVTGIDDTGSLQCAVTFPGMLRRHAGPDAITTVPRAGATGVPRSELARETPFTPAQFVGLPGTRRTGRELFVYLNRRGEIGQAPVHVVRAALHAGRRTVPVRWVDASTHTLGPYLAGAILVPLRPLAPATGYRASVAVQDGTRTLTRVWRFTTR